MFWYRLLLLIALVRAFKINPEFSTWVGCISHHEAKEILNFRTKVDITKDLSISSSIDLNMSQKPIILTSEGLCITSAETLLATWDELKDIADKGQGCYSLYDDGSKPWHVSTLSKSTGIPASLCPPLVGAGAPTMKLYV